MSEPAHRRARFLARFVLVVGCLGGLSVYVATPWLSPDQVMLASDVYRHAAARMLAGEGLYGSHPPGRPGYTYLYPPIVTIVFLPHALLDTSIRAFALQTVLNIGAAIVTAVVTWRLLRRRGVSVRPFDRGLLVGFFLLSSYSAIQFINGQINLWLGLAVALGFAALDRDRPVLAGGAFAIPALFKVFPVLIGLWLARLRAWRTIGAATAAGLGGLVAGGLLLGPSLTRSYLTEVLLARFHGSTFPGRPDPAAHVGGIHRQLAAIWPAGSTWHTPLAIVILGTLLATALWRVDTDRRRDTGALATLIVMLLFFPLQPLYFPLLAVPLVLVLYRLPPGAPGWLLIVGAVVTMVRTEHAAATAAIRVAPLPGGLTAWLVGVSDVMFRTILPPTLGLWILLAACVIYQVRGNGGRPDWMSTVHR